MRRARGSPSVISGFFLPGFSSRHLGRYFVNSKIASSSVSFSERLSSITYWMVRSTSGVSDLLTTSYARWNGFISAIRLMSRSLRLTILLAILMNLLPESSGPTTCSPCVAIVRIVCFATASTSSSLRSGYVSRIILGIYCCPVKVFQTK